MNRTFLLAAALFMSAAFISCNDGNQANQKDRIQSVYVTTPAQSPSSASHNYTSAVEEGKSVNVSFKTGGQIKNLSVKEGDYVKKGQIIGRLDDVDYNLSVQQLEAQYNQMTSEMKRLDEMFKRNNISANDYEKAKSGYEQLKASLDMTRNKLAYTRLESPVSGYVTERFMEDGEMVGAGTPIYKILDNSSLETSVALPAAVYSRKDEIISCIGRSSTTGDADIPLEIISFVPDGDNNSLFRLRLAIPSSFKQKLMPGMNLSVKINFKSSDEIITTMIPSRAIFNRDGNEYVWFVNADNSTINSKQISIVGSPVGKNSIVTGLNGDETIVAVGVNHLAEDEEVNVIGDINQLK